jgi:hypothetical protein
MADTIIVPRRKEDFFDERGDPTHRFVRWIESVTGQTNTSAIEVENNEQVLTSTGSRVSRNAARIDGLEFIRFRVVEVTADYTASPFEIVICNNVVPITITLEPNAVIEDQIHVKRKQSAAQVTVSGTIDGDTGRIINVQNWSDFYVFGATEWAVI